MKTKYGITHHAFFESVTKTKDFRTDNNSFERIDYHVKKDIHFFFVHRRKNAEIFVNTITVKNPVIKEKSENYAYLTTEKIVNQEFFHESIRLKIEGKYLFKSYNGSTWDKMVLLNWNIFKHKPLILLDLNYTSLFKYTFQHNISYGDIQKDLIDEIEYNIHLDDSFRTLTSNGNINDIIREIKRFVFFR